MRRSRDATAESRRRILAEAARLLRERGVDGVSVAEVMGAAGLTHGGFYGHFPSKEALVAAAAEEAFDEPLRDLEGQEPGALARYVDGYLSVGHARALGQGCPIAGLAPDAARVGGPLSAAVAKGAERTIEAIAAHLGGDDPRPEAMHLLALMLGSVVLARALGDPKAQDEVMAALRRARTAVAALGVVPQNF